MHEYGKAEVLVRCGVGERLFALDLVNVLRDGPPNRCLRSSIASLELIVGRGAMCTGASVDVHGESPCVADVKLAALVGME